MAFLIGGANSAADTGYNVDNSCRFNSADSAELTKTPGGAGNLDAWTLSFWFKRSNISGAGATSYQALYGVYADANNQEILAIQNDDKMYWQLYQSGSVVGQLTTTRVFRDVGAWYNVVISYDSANGTAGNRMRMWINGTEETSFSTDTNPSSGLDSQWNGTTKHQIGMITTTNKFDGYMAEIVSLDGTAVTDATNFGEFDSDSPTIWKPKDVSGLSGSKGTNGFYLDFEDSSNLGNDVYGGTDFSEDNIVAADQATDTPTNNFATLNSNHLKDGVAYAEGNCKVTMSKLHNHRMGQGSTIAAASGKWYCEVKCKGGHDPDDPSVQLGVLIPEYFDHDDHLGNHAGGWQYAANGSKAHSGTATHDHADTYDVDDIVSIAMDLDNHKLYFAKNGTWQDSGDPTSGSTGTGSFFDLDTGEFYSFSLSAYDAGTDPFYEWNFGGCPAFAISSGNADANGYGNFEYAPPSGYYALCTKNLAEFG